PRVGCVNVGLDNIGALVVYFAGQARLALDVYYAVGAGCRLRRNDSRPAEAVVTPVEDGQAVDAANCLALEFDEELASADLLVNFLFGQVQQESASGKSLHDCIAVNYCLAALAGPIVRLAQRVGDEAE